MSIKRWILLVLLLGLTALFVMQAHQVPSLIQYVFLPPDFSAAEETQQGGEEGQAGQGTPQVELPGKLDLFMKSWNSFLDEQQASIQAAALSAHQGGAALTVENGGSATAELTALYGARHTLEDKVLVNGRQLYQEEVDLGTPSAVIDEGLAIALFRQGNPVDMQFTLGDQVFTVVGITRHNRTVGERADYGLMVPLKAFETQPTWEVMTAQVRPLGGAGTRAGLGKSLQAWQSGGQVVDLVKEKYRAALPVRVLLCLLGMFVSLIGFQLARRFSTALLEKNRERLQSEYISRLWPRYVLTGALIALSFGAALLVLLVAFTQLLAPVYVFPEWVPAILVEPKEIARTFWNNRASATALLQMHTKEGHFLRTLLGYITVLCLLAGALLLVPLTNFYKKVSARD